ncbi:hypothetical protein [Macrococcoides caseolyticum]|uniref:hypothetical protein n=1 Tax=Macrococcoides caseolyticum TaxID=69966 RepID=UPI002A24D015|nr:hypothetical protein [Macrococcus caseolyticus]
MIKVGDKFTGIYGRKEVVTSIWLNNKTVGVESGLAYSYEEVYKSWYQQQKQRADELESLLYTYRENAKSIPDLIEKIQASNKRVDVLEKRWEKLKEHFIKEKEQSFGMLSWSRNNGVLELMERLEEDDND